MKAQNPGQGEDEGFKLDDLVELRVGATTGQSREKRTALRI